MKQIFVTHTNQPKKKPVHPELFHCEEKKETSLIEKPSSSFQSEFQNNCILNTSASSTTTNSSNTESHKSSCNFITNEMIQMNVNPNINFNVNNTNNNNYNYCQENEKSKQGKKKGDNSKNHFLGKKTKSKIRFDIIKQEEKKPPYFNINKFSINNQNILNSPNTNSTEGTLANNKDIEKSDSNDTFDFNTLNTVNLFQPKNSKDITDTDNINENLKNKKDKNGVNEGRWSYEEHIKFIEGIISYGKNWKNVQNYVGSRTSAQARSHAQKFFLKLKTMKNNKFNFDFSGDNVKSLSDVINIIKKTNSNREYMINTLISLSDSISINETNTDSDLCKRKNSDKIVKEKEKDKIEFLLNNNGDNNNFNNNIKKDEKIKIDNNMNKVKELKEINIIKENHIINPEEQKKKEEINYINVPKKQRYVFDDGVFFLSDGSEFFNMDDISLRIKDYLFMKNMKSPYLKFLSTFFS